MTARALAMVAMLALAAPATAGPIAIVGARVHVRPGQTLDGATVVLDRGRVIAVGVGVAVPAGAQVIDGQGKVVTAGFIEPLSGVGLVGIDLEASSVDGRHGPVDDLHDDAVQAGYQARDGFDPGAVAIAVARSGGVTLVVAAPVGGLVAGQSAAFALDGGVAPSRAPAAPVSAPHSIPPNHEVWNGLTVGIGLILLNPAAIVTWVVVVGSHLNDLTPLEAGAAATGVFFGSLAWFSFVAYIADKGKRFMGERAVWIMRVVGVCLVGYGLYSLARAIRYFAA